MNNVFDESFCFSDFEQDLRICALAARVCYSDESVYEILEDQKVNGEMCSEYLNKIIKLKHYSVFSHDFIYKNNVDSLSLSSELFKSCYVDKETIGVSFRHFLENKKDFIIPENINSNKIQILDKIENDDIKVYLLSANKEHHKYAALFVEGVSRVTSHQIVRYSSLNFCQRSQRYCNEQNNKFLFPNMSYINNEQDRHEATVKLQVFYENQKKLYNELMSLGMRKEDARYTLPNAAETSFLMSGTIKNLKHFIEQRKDKHAQTEIRNMANIVEELLDRNFCLS